MILSQLRKAAATQGRAVKRLLRQLELDTSVSFELFQMMLYSRAKLAGHYALEALREEE